MVQFRYFANMISVFKSIRTFHIVLQFSHCLIFSEILSATAVGGDKPNGSTK